MIQRIALGFLVGGLLLAGSAMAEDGRIAIIVSQEWSEARDADLTTLRSLYLGRRSKFAGRRSQPLHQLAGSPIRQGFNRTVMGRTEEELAKHWIQQALTGGANPPRERRSFASVVRAVAHEEGVVGYVDLAELTRAAPPEVKVLAVWVGGELLHPSESGYTLTYAKAP